MKIFKNWLTDLILMRWLWWWISWYLFIWLFRKFWILLIKIFVLFYLIVGWLSSIYWYFWCTGQDYFNQKTSSYRTTQWVLFFCLLFCIVSFITKWCIDIDYNNIDGYLFDDLCFFQKKCFFNNDWQLLFFDFDFFLAILTSKVFDHQQHQKQQQLEDWSCKFFFWQEKSFNFSKFLLSILLDIEKRKI